MRPAAPNLPDYSYKDVHAKEAESPKVDQDKPASPHAREIEYALILQRMIDMVNQDPSQMRSAIYDFARARLKISGVSTGSGEMTRSRRARRPWCSLVSARSRR